MPATEQQHQHPAAQGQQEAMSAVKDWEIVRHSPTLTCYGDGDWDYYCPKCFQPFHPAIAGHGRPCPRYAPKIEHRTDGTRDWFAVTCGQCGYHEEDPGDEPVYLLPDRATVSGGVVVQYVDQRAEPLSFWRQLFRSPW